MGLTDKPGSSAGVIPSNLPPQTTQCKTYNFMAGDKIKALMASKDLDGISSMKLLMQKGDEFSSDETATQEKTWEFNDDE